MIAEAGATLSGVTITDGQGKEDDGDTGYSVSGNTIKIGYGGGMCIGCSHIDMADVIVRNCAGYHAGGIFTLPNGRIDMERCIITANQSAMNAGGMWNNGARVYMNHCTISDIISGQQAGGYYSINAEGAPSISRIYNSTFSGNDNTTKNAGRSGGAAYIREYSDAVFVNCTFSGNKAGNGGAIQCYGNSGARGSVTYVISCTIADNVATNLGGGISHWNDFAKLYLYNSIVTRNTAPDGMDFGYGANVKDQTKVDWSSTVIGSSLYATKTSVIGGFDPSFLKPIADNGGLVKTCALESNFANTAINGGMSKADLDAIGTSLNPVIESSVFDTDARGVIRTKLNLGAYTVNE